MHGSDYWVDVRGFFHAALKIKVDRDQIVACHPIGPIKDVSNPPAFIVKFVFRYQGPSLGPKTFLTGLFEHC